MTWGEFKKWMDERVDNDQQIAFIDIQGFEFGSFRVNKQGDEIEVW